MQARRSAAIIDFPLDRARPPRSGAAGVSAEVLIFTGVRVERMYDLAERLPPARPGHVSKARMDIDFR